MKGRLFAATGTIAAGAVAVAGGAYLREIRAARRRIEDERRMVDSIEFALSGDGPSVLVIHGAGGGFDQGLDIGRAYLDGSYRIVAPSRFGYLGTPLPADASPEAQADVYVRLLDALKVDTVPVIGVSAGAPSAMQFVVRHPERCSALVLIVPMAWQPERAPVRTLPPAVAAIVNTLLRSDFLFWTAMKVAHSMLLESILGVPLPVYRSATREERFAVDEMMRSILPVSRRAAGLANETVVASTLTRYPLESSHVPALVISARDCLYGTYESARYTAEQIPGAKFIGFETGGHLLVGHETEVRTHVTHFLEERLIATTTVADRELSIIDA